MAGRARAGRLLLVFFSVRAAPAAAGFTVAGWLYLALAAPSTAVPFGQRAVPSPLIWPAAAAVSTMLLSCSQLTSWELRSTRRLWPSRLGLAIAVVLADLGAAVALRPAYAVTSVLAWFAALQAVALASATLFGERAWLPLSAVLLAAVFELAQDGSWLSARLASGGVPALVVASTLALGLAAAGATDRAQRLRPTSA